MGGLARDELQAIDRALSKTISHLIATADDTPYPDDPRWSPWTRFQKPLAERCLEARRPVRALLRGRADHLNPEEPRPRNHAPWCSVEHEGPCAFNPEAEPDE